VRRFPPFSQVLPTWEQNQGPRQTHQRLSNQPVHRPQTAKWRALPNFGRLENPEGKKVETENMKRQSAQNGHKSPHPRVRSDSGLTAIFATIIHLT
jgi:hypothetical protein